LADLDVRENLLDRILIYHRPDVSFFVQTGSKPQPSGSFHEQVCKLSRDLLVNHDPRSSGAALARSSKRTPQHYFDGQIQIGVLHDHHYVLAAHFKRTDLVAGGGRLPYDSSDFG